MSRILAIVLTLIMIIPVFEASAQIDVSGLINGTWTRANAPFIVVGDIVVANLTIEPGVSVLFDSTYLFTVAGKLTAVGTETDSIIFQAFDSTAWWDGVHFDEGNPGSQLAYCIIRDSQNSGIRIDRAEPMIQNCLIEHNAAPLEGAGIRCVGAKALAITGCTIRNNGIDTSNDALRGGGLYIDGDATIVDCTFEANRVFGDAPTTPGGGIYATGNLTLRQCRLLANVIRAWSGGFHGASTTTQGAGLWVRGTLVAENCLIADNIGDTIGGSNHSSATAAGPGFFVDGWCSVRNCIFLQNVARVNAAGRYPLGALYVNASDSLASEVVNSTFAENDGEGLRAAGDTILVKNSVFWDNSMNQVVGTAAVSFSDVQGGHDGTGNLDVNPIFTTNYAISIPSLAIDAGDPSPEFDDECFPPSLGNSRNDMGAHGGPGACGWTVCQSLGAPRRPSNVTAFAASNSVQLAWTANCEPDLSSYRVYRSAGTADPKTIVGTVSRDSTSFSDNAVTANVVYFYAITATDSSSTESERSIDAIAVPGDTNPPVAPRSVSIEREDASLRLAWRPNEEVDVSHYIVYRGTTTTPEDSIARLSGSIATYVDIGILEGQQYCYRLRAFDFSGLASDYSESVCARIEVADLALVGRVSNSAPNVDEPFTMTIVLRNLGPNDAADVSVENPRPPSLTFSSVAVSDGSFFNGFWRVPRIAAGDSATLVITALANDLSRGDDTAHISSASARDPNAANDSTVIIITPPQADLVLAKSVDDTSPTLGVAIRYTVDLTNGGPGTATGIRVEDAIPAGIAMDSSSVSAGTYTSGAWTVPTLGPLATARLTIDAHVTASGAITNIASITDADQFDPDPNNNIARATTSDSLGDLSVTVIVDETTPRLGNSVTFTVTVANGGPARATGIVVATGAPTGLTFTSTTPTSGQYAGGVWTIPSLLSGENETLTLVAKTGRTGSIVYTATVAESDQADPVAGNNAASAMITIADNPSPDVGIDPDTPTMVDTMVVDSVEVSGGATDDVGVTRAVLNYRSGGQTSFTAVEMETLGGAWVGAIPPGSFTSRGILYYIMAEDSDGLEKESDRSSVAVTVAAVSARSTQHAGRRAMDYRLISPPLDLADKTPQALLEDDLGAYDKTKWRFFDLDESEDYIEYPDVADEFIVVPGRAFLLAVANENIRLDTGSAATLPLHEEFAHTLNVGWNFVGNPFDFPIAVDNVRMESGDALDLRTFEGEWQAMPSSGVLEPFAGCALYALRSGDRFIINPGIEARKAANVAAERAVLAWSVRIIAEAAGARDGDNIAAAISRGASLGWDPHDRPEPPPVGDYVSVSFPHGEWGMRAKSYSTDARPEPVEGTIWNFDVRTQVEESITLLFHDVESVPSDLRVVLVDEFLRTTTDLRQTGHYNLRSAGAGSASRFSLIVGRHSFIEHSRDEMELIPGAVVLETNVPNPFNPATTIRFGLPRESRVTLRIFDAGGRQVRTLILGELLPEGHHAASWDGRNDRGRDAASGIYLYRLETPDGTRTRRMVLMR